jgi:hypothetical protein
MTPDEKLNVYIVRHEDRKEWRAKANSGEEVARVCLWAISKWIKDLPTEYSACSCCDAVFSESDVPKAFVVLIPAVDDPENVKATAGGVCLECSKHDNQWLLDQSIRRKGLSAASRRRGDQIH